MKRLLLPDLLKGLAAFFMVQIHITELFLDPTGRESVFGKTSLFLGGPFAAIVFMGVMGYFIAKNKGTTIQNIVRGIKIFILGFVLNIGLNFHLLLKIRFDDWPYNPLEYLFGIDILYLAGISIVILTLLKSFRKIQAPAAIILLMITALLTGFMNENLTVTEHYYILPFIAGTYPWSYFPLFPWLVYPLAGFIFAAYEEKIRLFLKSKKAISTSGIAVIVVLVAFFYKQGINTTINLPDYYHHTFGYILWALGLTLIWIYILHLLLKLFPDTFMGNFFCWIGKNITIFYVIQWLIIGNIATAIYQTQNLGQYWFWFTGIFSATVLLTFLAEKIKQRLLRKSAKSKNQILANASSD